jgi:hypothetical protein
MYIKTTNESTLVYVVPSSINGENLKQNGMLKNTMQI